MIMNIMIIVIVIVVILAVSRGEFATRSVYETSLGSRGFDIRQILKSKGWSN